MRCGSPPATWKVAYKTLAIYSAARVHVFLSQSRLIFAKMDIKPAMKLFSSNSATDKLVI